MNKGGRWKDERKEGGWKDERKGERGDKEGGKEEREGVGTWRRRKEEMEERDGVGREGERTATL